MQSTKRRVSRSQAQVNAIRDEDIMGTRGRRGQGYMWTDPRTGKKAYYYPGDS